MTFLPLTKKTSCRSVLISMSPISPASSGSTGEQHQVSSTAAALVEQQERKGSAGRQHRHYRTMHRRLLLLRLQNASCTLKNNATKTGATQVPGLEEDEMASAGLDPYEQQLFAVFESCCDPNSAQALDSRGLGALCEKLQLEEQTPHLLEKLLGGRNNSSPRKITFSQFRDALLALLAGGITSDEFDGSPEREVRPKFVYGRKKYGRRSKPEDDMDGDLSGSESDPPSPTNVRNLKEDKNTAMSTSETAKKRKTSQDKGSPSKSENEAKLTLRWVGELSEEEECVRATWEKLGASHEGYLGREELKLVCKASGLEGAADELVQQLFERVGVEPDGRISFEQFLRLFRSGLGTPAAEVEHTNIEHHRSLSFHTDGSSKEPLYISLDSCNTGMVTSEQLLEMLETGGVPGAARLLHDLGLGSTVRRPISLQELASALEEEAKALVDEQRGNLSRSQQQSQSQNPLMSVLHASVLIYQAETKCLKSSLEQALCERNKLRQDLVEANDRASLLAQEVDDRHMRLEDSFKKQVGMLEQKHSDEVRGLQSELSADREQMSVLTTGLELRMGQMQNEESKLRAELTTWLKKSEMLEKENNHLKELLSESDDIKIQLQKRVDSIPDLQIRLTDLEKEQAEVHSQQVRPLHAKMEALLAENTALRDANDELTLKLEHASISNKSLMETDDVEVVSPRGSSKRKGRPSDICSDDSSEDEIRPQGKQRRKAAIDKSDETMQLRERVVELERKLADCQERLQEACRSASSRLSGPERRHSGVEPLHPLKQVFQVVRAQILEEILGKPEEVDDHPLLQEISRLQTRCEDLTQLQKTMEADFEMQLCNAKEEKEKELIALKNSVKINLKPHSLPASPRSAKQGESLKESMEGSSKNVLQLEQDCNHLRENLDQVKEEIVRILSDKDATSKENTALKEQITELANKVEVSTQHPSDSFTEEMSVVSAPDETKQLRERVKELESCLELMQDEYEKCEDYWQGKLDDERRLYEQEQEMESKKLLELQEKIQELLSQEQEEARQKGRLSPIDERVLMEQQVNDLEIECEMLRERLHFFETKNSSFNFQRMETTDAATQTDAPAKSRLAAHFSNSSIILCSTSDKQIQANLCLEDLSQNRNPYELISPPDSSRKHYNGTAFVKLVESPRSNQGRAPEQSCRVQLSVMQALSERLQQQEVKSRRLEATLAQHHYHMERLIQQHHDEVASLQSALQAAQIRLQHQIQAFEEQAEKLACTDMMVKDLYIENSLLIASVDRLEKQCMFLSQHAPGSA